MREVLFSFLFLLLSLCSGHCQRGQMCVSVLTSEPGQELYTLFGHTAIRIRNDSLRFDRVYNFGTFDFSSPFFYINFLTGKLDYFLSVDAFSRFKQDIITENRKVHEQVLDLTEARKQVIFSQLESTFHSPDRYYRYDFFGDNCATRVRDVILKESDIKRMADTGAYCCKTFRELLLPYIRNNYWLNLGIHLALGRSADKTASVFESMFLPDYIMYILKDSPFVAEESVLFSVPAREAENSWLSYVWPWVICILIVIASVWYRTRRTALCLISCVFGLLGLFLLFMSLFSDLRTFSGNINICWTLPALVMPLIHRAFPGKIFLVAYAFFLMILLILCAVTYTGLSATFIPWVLMLLAVILADLGVFSGKVKHV